MTENNKDSVIKQFIFKDLQSNALTKTNSEIDEFINGLITRRCMDPDKPIDEQPYEVIDEIYEFLGYQCF